MERRDIDLVLDRIDLAEIARRFVPDLKAKGREWLGCCPFHAERTPSFTIFKSRGVQRFKCFGCGETGDALAFVMKTSQVDFAAALRMLADDAGLSDDPVARARAARRAAENAAAAARREERDRARRMASAAEIWRSSRPAFGTIAERYLRARGIPLDEIGGMPPTLRYLAAHYHREAGRELPAMVAACQGPDGRVAAVHLTYLKPDGTGKADVSPAKRMIGPAWGGAVRFGPVARHIKLAEGIETGLSVLASPSVIAAVREGELSVWAALSLGNIAGAGQGKGARRVPGDPRYFDDRGRVARLPSAAPDMERPGLVLPGQVREVTICADGDGKDPPAADAQLARAATRWLREGRRVYVAKPPAGKDFNDLINGSASDPQAPGWPREQAPDLQSGAHGGAQGPAEAGSEAGT